MLHPRIRALAGFALALTAAASLVACGRSKAPVDPDLSAGATGRNFLIKPGDQATTEMIAAMIQAAPGDVIEFDCGYFELTSSLQLTNTEDVLVKGCGKDKTVLSFKHNNAPEGVLAVNVHGLTVQDLTVLDTGGNGFELRGVDHGTLRRVRAIWSSGGGRQSADPITAANFSERLDVPCTDPATRNPEAPENTIGADTTSPDYTVSKLSGRYGIYPVSSENILIEDSESIGASDAGIYVGQTNTAIIKNSRAAFNVFGFEIENVQGGEYAHNLAECNTGGFLIYDLDGLRQYGDRSRMYGNLSRNNNTYNFTSGGIVGAVPPGSGMITLSYDRIDIFENTFENNNTGGIIHASYELFPEGAGRPEEKRIDWYTEGVHIFKNKFINNGNALPPPTTNDLQNGDVARILPVLVGLKTQAGCLQPANAATCASTGGSGYRGAHIVWDGLLDSHDADCAYPVDANGDPVPKDARGKPVLTNEVPNPSCHYNAYKFDTAASGAPRIQPDWSASCIDDDNEFSDDSIAFSNFHGLKGLEPVIALAVADPTDPAALIGAVTSLSVAGLQQFAADLDLAPHNCGVTYGKNLPLLPPVVIPPFVRSGDYDPAPAQALVDKLCNAKVGGGKVNFEAAKVNCPTLDQYQLFDNAEDPTSKPNGGGVPYSLTSKLFSDYTVKYRVAYLPPGTKAVYRDAAGDGVNATIIFPTGTIIAKTFSFADESKGTEVPAETRLLIKRVNSKGVARWDGMSYIWSTDAGSGKRVAKLALGGGSMAAAWDHTDVDSGLKHTGSTPNYLIPHANQCLSCHSREDSEAGAAPIGLKVRMMNKPFLTESKVVNGQSQHEAHGQNQIAYWCSKGILAGCPSDLGVDDMKQIATKLERIPVFNKPGDSGFEANSAQDIEKRARAWLEVNCQHCHNVKGFAGSTGFYLDSFRPVDSTYGICKHPTATGQEGNGGRSVDFHPGSSADSIVEHRIGPTATTPAARMPPLARSVIDAEGHALVKQWIDTVLVADEAKYPGSTSCTE
ncbi:MAG: parallel beta-helix domain-containing protein [Stagnimonas sp.]|nr:parallel beta-helix domain-containing protein [Stagnimonas sp.]